MSNTIITDTEFRFSGFQNPNYTLVPDELFDELLAILTGAELKVLLYIIRRTFGFKKSSDNISLSQMLQGITTRDGHILDRGVGIRDKKTLLSAIKTLAKKNIIITERRSSLEKGNEPTTYKLNILASSSLGKMPLPLGGKSHQGVGGEIPPGPWGGNPPIQESVLQESDKQNSNSKGNHFESKIASNTSLEMEQYPNKTNPRRGDSPRTFSSTADILAKYSQSNTEVSKEDREIIQTYMHDFAREFNDSAPIASSTTRAVNLYIKSKLSREAFIKAMYEARSLTKQRTASIRTKDTAGSKEQPLKRKMGYFFSVLSDKLGL